MKKSCKLFVGLFVAVFCVFLMTGCPSPVTPVVSASPAPTTSAATTPPPLSDHVALGIQELIDRDFNGALTEFSTAITVNPQDNDAKLWVSLMDLASISVDPTVTALFRDSIGVANYPEDMNELFRDSWFNGTFYIPHDGFEVNTGGWYVRGDLSATVGPDQYEYYDANHNNYITNNTFIPSDSGVYYASYWYYDTGSGIVPQGSYSVPALTTYMPVYNIVDSASEPLPLPELEVPVWYANLTGYSGGQRSIYEYGPLLIANIATRNPSGFNAILDSVKTVSLGSTLDTVIGRIESLSDTARVYLPWNLIESFSGSQQPDTLADKYITIGKGELLLYVAQLRAYRSMVQYLSSVNLVSSGIVGQLTGSLATFDPEDETDADGDEIPDNVETLLNSIDGFYNSTLLTDRNLTDRAASKASFLQALSTLQTAGNLLAAQWANSASYYNDMATTLEMPQEVRDQVGPAIQRAIEASQKLYTAINDNSTLIVPLSDMDEILSNGFAWPTLDDQTTGIGINPGALWAFNVLNPREWFEADGNGFIPHVCFSGIFFSDYHPDYPGFCFEYTEQTGLTLADYGNPENYPEISRIDAAPGLQLRLSRLQQFIPSYDAATMAGESMLGLGLMPSYPVYSTNPADTVILDPPAELFFIVDWLNKSN
jgi:hypothetical protein